MVEGYTDVISLHQAGIENIVASSGTSLTVEQVQLIKRYTPNLTILYDGDNAGIKAALRGMDLVIEADMNVRIVLLPDGEDPDSYLQKVGTDTFKAYLQKQAKDFIIFKIDLLLDETASDPIKRADALRSIVESIARVPDGLKRSIYVKECAQLMEIAEQVINTEVNKMLGKMAEDRQKEQRRKQRMNARQSGNQGANIPPSRSQPTKPKPSGNPDEYPAEYWDDLEATDKARDNKNKPQSNPANDEGFWSTYEQIGFDEEQSSDQAQPMGQEGFIGNASKINDIAQELDLVRVLINFGQEQLDEEYTIAEFILLDMADLLDAFDHSACAFVVQECLSLLEAGEAVTTNYFVYHQRQEIAKLAADLVSLMEEYQFSPGWEKLQVFLTTQKAPEENYIPDAKSSILYFKFAKIKRLIEENAEKLKRAQQNKNDIEDLMLLLRIQQKLYAKRAELAAVLNIVVVK